MSNFTIQGQNSHDQKNIWQIPSIVQWSQILLNAYAALLGQELIPREGTPLEQSERLFYSPFVVASHGNQEDPILNYGNQTALDLWELTWEEFTRTPSRLTAEPMNREERARMLHQAQTQGFITDYRGIRISRSGRRFLVDNATVWNISTPKGDLMGQAATFSDWSFLEQPQT